MAAEGTRLTSFYLAAPVCTPSRAALMTGCHPQRVSMDTGSSFPVLLAGDPKGLNPDEITIAETDWSVGQILDTLKAQGVDEDTFVIFTTDNGPAIGSAGPLKGRKGSTFEGGMRESTVVRWPGKIPASESNSELMTAMDLLPTFANLAGAEIPTDRVIDGRDIWPVLTGNEEVVDSQSRFVYSTDRREWPQVSFAGVQASACPSSPAR